MSLSTTITKFLKLNPKKVTDIGFLIVLEQKKNKHENYNY